ncbi:MAG: magnesium transporter [Candidatus Bathyarchaeota archaeon]|nr:MAG: magnesium transporter [Candidatus Bathyarchaeota archaeon]
MRSFSQSALSLSFNLGGLLTGTFLVMYLNVFTQAPWVLSLLPGILSVRGAVGGLFTARLSTALRIGTIEANFRQNTRVFQLLFSAMITLTFISSIVIGLTGGLVNTLFFGLAIKDIVTILLVIVTTMGFSLFLLSPITLGISIISYKQGLNPDITVYPVISTIADILVTLSYVSVLHIIFSFPLGILLILIFDILFLLTTCYLIAKNYAETQFVSTLKEFQLTLILVTVIVTITGLMFTRISKILNLSPKLFLVYPTMITTIGAVGAIVGSTATTKLALGLFPPSFSSIKYHLVEISNAWAASLFLYALLASIAFAFSPSRLIGEYSKLILQFFLTNLLAGLVIILISFTIAIYTRQRGWDPDNFVIPLVSSVADSTTTLSLLLVLTKVT